jgi:hypothetical protein
MEGSILAGFRVSSRPMTCCSFYNIAADCKPAHHYCS